MIWLTLLAALVDFSGSIVVVIAAISCLWGYLRAAGRTASLDALRLRLAAGLVFALSLKTGAALLHTMTVTTWHAFAGMFFIIALRFFLGRVLKAEAARAPAS